MNLAIKLLAEKLSWLIGFIFLLLPLTTPLSTWLGSNFGHPDSWKLIPYILILISLPLAGSIAFTQTNLRNWLRGSLLVWLCSAYIGIHLLIGLWAISRHEVNASALVGGLISNLSFIGFFFVCLVSAYASKWLYRNWIKLTLLPAVIVVGFGWLERFVLPLGWLSHLGYGPKTTLAYQTVDAVNGPPRLQSTLRGPNPLGAYLSLVIPTLVIKFWKRWFWLGTVTAVALLVLFYSYSRSALAATIFASGLIVWWLASNKLRRWLVGAAVLIGIFASLGIYAGRNSYIVQENLFHTKTHSTSPQTSNTVRRLALRQGISDVAHHPLGHGPGAAGPVSVHNNHKARISENYYIQIAQEVGLIGLAFFIAINLVLAKQLWKIRQDNLVKLLLASLAGISLINMVSHAWADFTLSLIWWGLAGIAYGTLMLSSKHDSK